MPRSKSSYSRGSSDSGSGSSGLFQGIGAQLVGGTINTCPADNDSWFCKFSRAFQILAWIVTIILIFVLIWALVPVLFGSKSKGGVSKMFKGRG